MIDGYHNDDIVFLALTSGLLSVGSIAELPAASTQIVDTVCGDGVLGPFAEACDDGNLAPLDGCSPTCTVEAGWSCSTGAPSVCLTFDSGPTEFGIIDTATSTFSLRLSAGASWSAQLGVGPAETADFLASLQGAAAPAPASFSVTVLPALTTASVTRVSPTVVLVTLPQSPLYAIDGPDAITVPAAGFPASVMASGAALVLSAPLAQTIADGGVRVTVSPAGSSPAPCTAGPTVQRTVLAGDTLTLDIRGSLAVAAAWQSGAGLALFDNLLITPTAEFITLTAHGNPVPSRPDGLTAAQIAVSPDLHTVTFSFLPCTSAYWVRAAGTGSANRPIPSTFTTSAVPTTITVTCSLAWP